MPERFVLYAIELLMLAAAVGVLLPTFLNKRLWAAERGRAADSSAEEARLSLSEALQAEKRRLEAERDRAAITEAEYADLLEDLKRRTLEEFQAADKSAAAGAKPRRFPCRRAPMAVGVVLMIALLSTTLYGAIGSPEFAELSGEERGAPASTQQMAYYLERHPDNGRAWVLLAGRYAEASQFEEAAQSYRKGMDAEPKIAGDPDVLMAYGAAVLTAGDAAQYESAKKALLRAQELRPDDERATELVGMIAFASGDWRLAKRTLLEIMRTLPPDQPAYVRLEETLRELDMRIDQESRAGA